MISDESLSQFDSAPAIGTFGGVAVVTGLMPVAASTPVSEVETAAREYHDTSSRPLAVAVRSAGNMLSPPPCGWSSRTGLAWTGRSVLLLKLCIRMSPNGWNLASFQTMDTVWYLSLTATRG